MLDDRRRDLLALLRPRTVDRSAVTRAALEDRLGDLLDDPWAVWGAPSLADHSADPAERMDGMRRQVAGILESAERRGISVVTVLDAGYPENLRQLADPPAFLFHRGCILPEDARACAVAGTRQCSREGELLAARWTEALLDRGLTIVSGLARGIDTIAHETALRHGARTIAVLGFGFDHMYPPENADLADRIAASGAVVSQFWPDTPPSRKTFPIRNMVSSGLSLGTVVIEASHTSGARMQARIALEQGRWVIFPPELFKTQAWAHSFVDRGARVVDLESMVAATENLASGPPTGGQPRSSTITDPPMRLFTVA